MVKYINKDAILSKEMTKKRWMNLIVNNIRIVSPHVGDVTNCCK